MASSNTETVLLVIDMQNDFIKNTESPFYIPGAEEILENVSNAVRSARRAHVPVIWVNREHDPSGMDVERFREHFYKDCDESGPLISGSEGAKNVKGLRCKGEFTIVKKRFSAFHQTNLDTLLRRYGCKNVIICGVQTPNCIRATAFDAVSLDYQTVTVLADATASVSKVVQESNLHDLRQIGVLTPYMKDSSTDCLFPKQSKTKESDEDDDLEEVEKPKRQRQ